jgi:hypothetical protein
VKILINLDKKCYTATHVSILDFPDAEKYLLTKVRTEE